MTLMWRTANLKQRAPNSHASVALQPTVADDPDPDLMAECDQCKQWFRQHCVDIPLEVFAETDVPWCWPNCRMGL